MQSLIKNVFITFKSDYPLVVKLEIIWALLTLFLKSRIIANEREVKQTLMGFTVSAYGYNALLYLFKEIFIKQEYYFRSRKSNPRIVDCGANIGMSILYFKYHFPDCEIIAFEPNPNSFAMLERNVKQNNITNVQINNTALSNCEGNIEFFVGEDKGSLTSSILRARGGTKTLHIHSEKLSKHIQNDVFDLIKIDIEGAESEVLADLVMTNRIANANQYIIEYHHRICSFRSSLADFIRPFEDSGFEYNLKTSFHRCGDYQDILLSFHKTDETTTKSVDY